MAKRKVIKSGNFPTRISLTGLIALWFLWDKFPFEWFRTILVILAFFMILLPIIAVIWLEEPTDIFE